MAWKEDWSVEARVAKSRQVGKKAQLLVMGTLLCDWASDLVFGSSWWEVRRDQ